MGLIGLIFLKNLAGFIKDSVRAIRGRSQQAKCIADVRCHWGIVIISLVSSVGGCQAVARKVAVIGLLWLASLPSSAELASDNLLDAQWLATSDELADAVAPRQFPFDSCFESASAAHNVPKLLLLAVARGESNFDPGAVSHADAYGVMQIRWPNTAKHLGVNHRFDLYDACINIDAGAKYLSELLELYEGNIHLALAAYNYGPSRISKSAGAIPSGASWYSDYIHGQLVRVLRGVDETYSKTQVLSSGSSFRAREILAYFKNKVPEAKFQMAKEGNQYRIWLLHANLIEYRHAESGLRRIGISFFEAR